MGVSFDVWTEVVLGHASARAVRRLQQNRYINYIWMIKEFTKQSNNCCYRNAVSYLSSILCKW